MITTFNQANVTQVCVVFFLSMHFNFLLYWLQCFKSVNQSRHILSYNCFNSVLFIDVSPLVNSTALTSCHSRVYQSLGNLIRWADQVMLDGIDLEDKENVAAVTSVIKAVLDGVKVGLSLPESL